MLMRGPAALLLVTLAVFADEHGEDGHAIEYGGSFTLMPNVGYTWQAQKTGCPLTQQSYADPTMKFIIVELTNTSRAALMAAEEAAEELLEAQNLPVVRSTNQIPVGTAVTLEFDQSVGTSQFPISVEPSANNPNNAYGIFTEHGPLEFEFDQHYLIDSDGTDVEPEALMAEGDGEHAHGHSEECVLPTDRPDCGCTNAGTLNCGDPDDVLRSFEYLENNACSEQCNCYQEGCRDAFFVVDMHHSGCNAEQLPKIVEEKFHDYELSCQRCYTSPFQNPVLETCAPIDCKNSDIINGNYSLLETPECLADRCKSAECQKAWQITIAYHDECCGEDLPDALSDGFHDLEEVCLGGCNIPEVEGYTVNCSLSKNLGFITEGEKTENNDDNNNDDDDKLSTGAIVGITIAAVAVFLALAFAVVYKCCLKPAAIDEAHVTAMKMKSSVAEEEVKAESQAV
mmetsp:Transcript_32434/g.60324  ORF Transcript_32434/g.60324 Transcript_32434/m.60324 type:complete len:455 (-) Transcript_32434:403-1767(-)